MAEHSCFFAITTAGKRFRRGRREAGVGARRGLMQADAGQQRRGFIAKQDAAAILGPTG